jgi:hypothetical protein
MAQNVRPWIDALTNDYAPLAVAAEGIEKLRQMYMVPTSIAITTCKSTHSNDHN